MKGNSFYAVSNLSVSAVSAEMKECFRLNSLMAEVEKSLRPICLMAETDHWI